MAASWYATVSMTNSTTSSTSGYYTMSSYGNSSWNYRPPKPQNNREAKHLLTKERG
jgi:hypothetical protein